MSKYKYIELKINKVFQALIPPLGLDEYKQLEENLLADGCRDPICVWKETIIDGHNRYEICLRHHIPFKTQQISLRNRHEAIAWICANQIGRRNISEEARRYLIGKRYESEKVIGILNIKGKNQHTSGHEVTPEMWAQPTAHGNVKRTSKRLGDEYHIAHSTIEKYGAYSRAIDTLAKKTDELAPKILSGQTKVSCENVIELSKLPARELNHISQQLIRDDRNFVGYAATRRDLENRHRKRKAIDTASEINVKNMPAFDPDAEISSLSLTIPSWISSIERTRSLANFDLASEKAKERLATMLNNLKGASDQLLDMIRV